MTTLSTRIVYHVLKHPDNTAWASGVVTFTLQPSLLNGDDIYPVQSIAVTANGSGQVTANLVPGNYLVELPSGERYYIAVPSTGTGTLQLSALITGQAPTTMDDDRWLNWKAALKEYSNYRPRTVPNAAWTPTAGSIEQTPPAHAVGVAYIDYGESAGLEEIYTAAETDQGWCFENGKLYLTPAPADGTTITVIWRMEHVPDEATRSCSTVPAKDLFIVDLLADALEAIEQQAAVEAGLSSYTIGGTTVKWSQQGGGTTSTMTLGNRLKEQALAMLREPYTTLG